MAPTLIPCRLRATSPLAGERFAGSSDPATRAAAAAIQAAEADELAEKRRAKKAAFDSEYDEGASFVIHKCWQALASLLGWARAGGTCCGSVRCGGAPSRCARDPSAHPMAPRAAGGAKAVDDALPKQKAKAEEVRALPCLFPTIPCAAFPPLLPSCNPAPLAPPPCFTPLHFPPSPSPLNPPSRRRRRRSMTP